MPNPVASAIFSSFIDLISNAPPPGPPLPQSFIEVPGLQRMLPADARAGILQPIEQPNAAIIDGQPLRLAPGVQVRTARNALILPTMVTHVTTVRYLFDLTGAVHRIWVLSPEEAAALQP
jgi:hypothetical protein